VEPSVPPTIVIPVRLRGAEELDGLLRCLVATWSTIEDADVLVVDDHGPAELAGHLAAAASELGFELLRRREPGGLAAAANEGLSRALSAGRDAVLLAADVEPQPGWLELLLGRTDTEDRPAAVAGGRILLPSGLLAHAGMYFSAFRREWFHRYRFGPSELPAALLPCLCPVSGSMALIRHDAAQRVGLLDESLDDDYAVLDYCLRVFGAGLECVYEPSAVGHRVREPREYEREELVALQDVATRFRDKHRGTDFSLFVPEVL
jgi:GT2 family glycosyltransferase